MPAQGGPGVVQNLQAIRRARLMIDARKWRAAKLAPRKYGLRPGAEPAEEYHYEDILAALE